MSALPLGGSLLESQLLPHLRTVEERLVAETTRARDMTDAPASHLAKAGGKRLRPLLALLASQLGEGVSEDVITAAVSVELTHLATLYHDDVMDSAELRRGAPAAHEVWGNSVAILTGDLLLARASRLVAELGPQAVRIQAETFERLCLGQLHETMPREEGSDPVEHYLRVLSDKTGSLIAAAAQYGAIYGGAGGEAARVMADYGEKVGIAFQLADDVIDLASDSDTTGKTPGTDLREGVDTMPVLLLRARRGAGTLDEDGLRVLDAMGSSALTSDETLTDVVALLRRHEVVDEARTMARHWADEAKAALAVLPAGEVRDALEAFAGMLVERMA